MPSALVTGGAGFMGAAVARQLLEHGHDVVVLDDLSGGFADAVPEGAKFVRGDICDEDLVDDLFHRHPFSYVYHLAAYAAEGLSPYIRRHNYRVNLEGSATLINAAVEHEVRCFVFTSSIAVYGAQQPPFFEHMPTLPEDPYGIAKAAVEQDLEDARRRFGLPYVIFRPHNVYGPGQNLGDPFRNVVGIFMRQILEGQPLSIFGNGSQIRAFSYIDDVAPIIVEAAWKEAAHGKVFNIGGELPSTINELARAVCRAMDAQNHPTQNWPARDEVHVAYCDHGRLHRVFGNRLTTPLYEGLDLMAHWARQAGVRVTPRVPTIELDKNLPEAWRA